MDLSSLNVDVLLYLMKFVKPDDRFNLVLSGVLKGFENVHEGIDLRERIEDFRIELGPCRDGTCQLEIRSLNDQQYRYRPDSRLITLQRLADGRYLKNNRQMKVNWYFPSVSPLFRVIRSMNNLETLSLLKCELTLTDDLPQLFRSCPKLTELRIKLVESQKLEMNEDLRNELRSGCQRLRLVELHWGIESCPVIQEILTWLKECAQLTVLNYGSWTVAIDSSLTPDPDLSQNLRDLRLFGFPLEFVKWILPFCPIIHTLKLSLNEQPNDLHNEIVHLKKLKDLLIGTCNPKEIIRNCRQVEILRVDSTDISLRDVAELEHYTNLKEVHLRGLVHTSLKEALSMLKRCTNLRRITLKRTRRFFYSPKSCLELYDLMELKQLTFLHLIYRHIPDCDHFQFLVNQVNEFVSPRRPNFEFYLSCCGKCESRVSEEFFYY